MKRIISVFLAVCLLILPAGCGENESNKALKEYSDTMTVFFDDLVKINDDINKIDPESPSSLEDLYKQFDALEAKFQYLTTVKVPEEVIYYESIDSLSAEGYDYMKQANQYLHQAYQEEDFNDSVLEASLECYRRANKRIRYIISLIHGEVPKE